MGRFDKRFIRYYQDGYDLSGDVESIGELAWDYTHSPKACLNWEIMGGLNGAPTIGMGAINGVFNTDAAGWHSVALAQGQKRVMLPFGALAEPVMGDIVWGGVFNQSDYKTQPGDSLTTFTAAYNNVKAAAHAYAKPWGVLLSAKSSKTAAYTGAGVDNGAASAAGGWLMYQIFSITGTGTVTISVDDSTDNTTYGALSGATSGAIATASAPIAGIVELAKTAAVKRYIRPQIAFGGSATACVYALAFFRG